METEKGLERWNVFDIMSALVERTVLSSYIYLGAISVCGGDN